MARHYIGAGITHQLTPLIPLTGFVLLNLNDFSLSFSPQIEYNIAENIYISLGAYLGFGQGPKIEGPPDEDSIPDLRSEFGTYPDMAFASFRIYF
jgi:hypothetical protein